MKQPDLGLKIIELRQNKGLTQEELVTQCNISVRTLQRIESGEVEPRGYTLRLIARVLDFDLFSLNQQDAHHQSKTVEETNTEDMSTIDKTRQVLIRRYAALSSSTVDKISYKLETTRMEDILEKHQNMLTLSIVVFTLVSVSLVVQLLALYLTKNFNVMLVLNVIMVAIFQKGLQDNIEIKHILKTLNEMG